MKSKQTEIARGWIWTFGHKGKVHTTFEALTIGGMFVGTAAAIIFLSYVIFIVLTDYLMQLWREAKQKAKSE